MGYSTFTEEEMVRLEELRNRAKTPFAAVAFERANEEINWWAHKLQVERGKTYRAWALLTECLSLVDVRFGSELRRRIHLWIANDGPQP